MSQRDRKGGVCRVACVLQTAGQANKVQLVDESVSPAVCQSVAHNANPHTQQQLRVKVEVHVAVAACVCRVACVADGTAVRI